MMDKLMRWLRGEKPPASANHEAGRADVREVIRRSKARGAAAGARLEDLQARVMKEKMKRRLEIINGGKLSDTDW